MRRTMLLGVLLAIGVVGIVAGQAPQQPNVAEIEKVRDNLFMIKGGGGNTAAFITARGVVLVDTKDPGWGPAIMDKVRTVTDKPVIYIINTHTHGDHTGSNDFFPASVEVVAQENTKTNMQKMRPLMARRRSFCRTDVHGPLTISLAPSASSCITSAPATPTATPSSCFRRCGWLTPATCLPGQRRLDRLEQRRQRRGLSGDAEEGRDRHHRGRYRHSRPTPT